MCSLVWGIGEDGSEIVLSRSSEMLILDDQGREKARYRLQYGAKLLKKDGETVKAGQILAEWDPYTLPIIAEKDGIIKYLDLKQGVSFRDAVDDTTGISSKIVIDWSQNPKSKNFKPAINIQTSLASEEVDTNSFSNYPMSIDTILSVEDEQKVYAGQVLKSQG